MADVSIPELTDRIVWNLNCLLTYLLTYLFTYLLSYLFIHILNLVLAGSHLC